MINCKTVEYRVSARISRKKCAVLMREDFADLGNYSQVGRALRHLVAKGAIMKIGYGLYARYCSHEILAQRAIHLIWTAARNDDVFLA